MNVKQLEIESFLLRDICMTLPNVLNHLAGARQRGSGELIVPTEHVDAIVATLQHIHGRARILADRMLYVRPAMTGVSEALRRIVDEGPPQTSQSIVG